MEFNISKHECRSSLAPDSNLINTDQDKITAIDKINTFQNQGNIKDITAVSSPTFAREHSPSHCSNHTCIPTYSLLFIPTRLFPPDPLYTTNSHHYTCSFKLKKTNPLLKYIMYSNTPQTIPLSYSSPMWGGRPDFWAVCVAAMRSGAWVVFPEQGGRALAVWVQDIEVGWESK